MYSKKDIIGEIEYENRVIADVTGIAVSSCYGVVEMASVNRFKDALESVFSKQNFHQGVEVQLDDNGYIDLNIHVVLGYSIPVKNVSLEIKKRVVYELEKTLNIKIRDVKVIVEAVDRI